MISLEKGHSDIVSAICLEVLHVYTSDVVCGSRVGVTNGKYSDVDLAVKGVDVGSSNISAFWEAFEKSDLPMPNISLYRDMLEFLCRIYRLKRCRDFPTHPHLKIRII